MYKKYLVIASKLDKAGMNIINQLEQFRKNPVLTSMNNSANFDIQFCDKEIVYTGSLDLEKINQYDFIIFASRHESEKKQKTLSVHTPGNFRRADFGGESHKICKSSALFQKQLFGQLRYQAKKHNLENYKITLECTHHGPLIKKPCVFIEIGATSTEWEDRRAGFVIAKTIKYTIQNFKENPYNEIAVGIGGPHYCPGFNKVQLYSNVALSHVIPQYALPLTQEMIQEALEKTEEEVDFVLLDWKGIGNAEHRQQLLGILDKLYIEHKRINEIWK